MKYKIEFLLGLIGGVIGFIFHLVWHLKLDIDLFMFSGHIINGFLYTFVGVIIGLFMGYLIRRVRNFK